MRVSVPPLISLKRRDQGTWVNAEPMREVHEGRQRRQRLARFHLGDVGAREWSPKIRLAHSPRNALCPDPTPNLEGHKTIRLRALFSPA
jgi:hypothetical protein